MASSALSRPAVSNRASARCLVREVSSAPGWLQHMRERPALQVLPSGMTPAEHLNADKLSRAQILALERELDNGESIYWLRRFNKALSSLPDDETAVRAIMRPVWNELAYNLESFNPLFTAAVLKVQNTLGSSDYEARDTALAHLIQPLAGEYGLHHSIPLGNTHRQLFAEFYESVTGEQLSELLAQENQPPAAAQALFERMLTDVSTGGGREDPVEQASYALGYNLAVEYLAQYEKGWLLDSFRELNRRVLAPAGREVEWLFLEVHADGEPEHADLGHAAVAAFAPECFKDAVRQGIRDHDTDFSAFYQCLTEMLEAQI